MFRKLVFTLISIFLFTTMIFADSVRISQIDSTTLLLNQKIKLYINVINDMGLPIGNLNFEDFSVYESANGRKFKKIDDIIDFETYANYESGVNFLLLIDNSGSMYLDMNGRSTRNRERMRIQYAKNAVMNFLNSVTNPKDTVGLVSYNTFYDSLSSPVNDRIKISTLLEDIKRPGREERYSEIYASLYNGVDEFKAIKGRKVIIILSDGQNQPFYRLTKKKHRDYGRKTFNYREPIKICQEEGVSVFAINFGKRGSRKDRNLNKIAYQTGGAVFDAHNPDELKDMYVKIVNQILNEYRITYRATMDPTDKKYVRVLANTRKGKVTATRFYFSSTIFGLPLKEFTWLLLLPLLLAILLAWLLSSLKFEKMVTEPFIEVLNPGTAKASTKLFSLSKNKQTVIGGNERADVTLVGGVSRIKEKHATILFDDRKNRYTVLSDGNMLVNNKPVRRKDLESGDVITIGDSIIVFDDGDV